LKLGDFGAYRGLSSIRSFRYKHWHLLNTLEPLSNGNDREEIACHILHGQDVPYDELLKTCNSGPSIFGLACRSGFAKVCDLMLNKCPNQEKFIQLMLTGMPQPLWLAANGGHHEILCMLNNLHWWNSEAANVLLFQSAPDGTRPLEVCIARKNVNAVLNLANLFVSANKIEDFFKTVLYLDAVSMLKPMLTLSSR